MRYLAPLAAVAAALALAGCQKAPPPDHSKVAEVSNTEPAFRMTAEEFRGQAEDEKFRGKVIELSGTVEDVGRSAGGEAFVELKTSGGLLGVMCFTADERPWASFARGQTVRLKGLWSEPLMAPRLLYCVVVEPGEYAAIRITATDLAKEYAADPDATVKKYEKKHVVVTGEVASKDVNEFKAVALVLKTDNKVKVECGFTAFDRDLSDQYAVGQTVRVFGEFSLNFGTGDTVHLNFCLPLTPPEK